jgi:hypothetical protein
MIKVSIKNEKLPKLPRFLNNVNIRYKFSENLEIGWATDLG